MLKILSFHAICGNFQKNNSKTTVVDKNVVESTDSTKAPVVFQEGEPISAIELRNECPEAEIKELRNEYLEAEIKEYLEKREKSQNEYPEAKRRKLHMLHNSGQAHLRKNTKYDDLRAFHYFLEACECDFAPSLYAIANMFLEGRGTKKDNLTALSLFKMAARLNFAPAQYFLGTMYEEGKIVDKDFQKAAEYYQQAAVQNHDEAQIKICTLCFNGKVAPESNQ